MGQDKSLLPFLDFPTLTQYQLNKFKNSYISCKDKNKFDFEANFIEDINDIYAPGIALLSAFKKLKQDYIFFISVDTPYFELKDLNKLLKFIDDGYEAIVPIYNNKQQPLCSIYSQKSMITLKTLYDKKEYKLQIFLKQINTKFVEFDDEKSFTNLNYFDEYQSSFEMG